MADEKRWTGSMRGRFLLGENHGEPGPGLGTLYEAWRAGSARPALVLLPGDDVDWRSAGPWRVILSCDDTRDSVSLEVEQAPAEVPLPELANLFVLMTSTLERVEDHPRVQAHMASGVGPVPVSLPARPSWAVSALALAAVYALGLGMGWMTSDSPSPAVDENPPGMDSGTTVLTDPMSLLDGGTPDAGIITYPLPAKPFRNQAPAPCRRNEVEFSGGCWMELSQRPPCDKDDLLEHQGKCYVPVARRIRPSQAVEPSGQ